MADAQRKSQRKLLPFLPALRLPGLPLPAPGLPRLARPAKKRSNFASTTVAITDTVVLGGGAASPAAPPCRVPLKPASDVLAGAIARAASQSTIHPLDTLKVRLQTKGRIGAPAAPGAASLGVSKFGQLVPPPGGFDIKAAGKSVASLYRGLVGAASGAGIAIGAYFAFYGVASNLLSRHTQLPASGVAFSSGAIAAAGSSVVKVPLAVCIRSVQAGIYPNVFAAANTIVAKVGPRGLFTGYFPTLLEDVPDMAFKFAAYECMRGLYKQLHRGRDAMPQEDFAMGAIAGAAAAAATTPLDVIKTNMMIAAASRPTMRSAAAAVYRQGGTAAFFNGVGTRAVSNGINSAVFFCFFEAIRKSFADRRGAAAARPLPALAAAPPPSQAALRSHFVRVEAEQ